MKLFIWLAMRTANGSTLYTREDDIRQFEGNDELGTYHVRLQGVESPIMITKESYEGLVRHVRREE